MTETPRIVTRVQRGRIVEAKEFRFTPDMIPAFGPNDPMTEFRHEAWKHFSRLPLPDTSMEAWRRTDLKGLAADTFRLPRKNEYLDLPSVPKSLLDPVAGEEHGGQVILLPGTATAELDGRIAEQGVIFSSLSDAFQQHPELISRVIGRVVRPDEGKFAALAASLAETGVLLYVPKGVHIEQPLHSILWGPGAGLAHISHLIVYLEEGASATYVHESASPDDESGQTLHCGLVELYVGAGASLNFVELQSWGNNVWNFTHERAKVDRSGTLDWVFGAIGSHLTKNFSDLDLTGQGAVGRMSGFYFADGNQHLDHDTQQNHQAPNTTSDLLYKGALEGRSRSVWQGMIYVAPEAMKTDGYQANRNLVLSPQARADSIPGLEILANDVRCTHGATVGKIDQELIFYLRSRGLLQEEAERLVVEGFFDPIMQRIPFEGVRGRFQQAIHDKMYSQKA